MSFIEQNLKKGEKLDEIDKPSLKPSLFALVISMGIVAYINLQEETIQGFQSMKDLKKLGEQLILQKIKVQKETEKLEEFKYKIN